MADSSRVAIEPAPTSPLNLRIGVAYAPRIPTPPFVAFAVAETTADVFEVFGYYDDGRGAVLAVGGVADAWQRFAAFLRRR